MAHFAELDDNNTVINVIVIGNEDCLDGNNNESEAVGISFCKDLFGEDRNWVQTSYNNSIRYNYAQIGGKYDPSADAFISLQPYESWVLDADYQWSAPEPYPNVIEEGESYDWDEDTGAWVLSGYI